MGQTAVVQAGVRGNILPGEVTMQGTIRAFDAARLAALQSMIEQSVQGLAASYGARARVSFEEQARVTRNDPALLEHLLPALRAAAGDAGVDTAATMRGAAEEKAIMQLARSAGVAVFASAGQDQVATEFRKLGHGVFTYTLLKGLNGAADGAPKDGKITVKELEAYINDQVPELTKIYRGKRQDPNSSTRGQDFPIGTKEGL